MRNKHSKLALLALTATSMFSLGQNNTGCGTNDRVNRIQNQQELFEITHSVERDNYNARLKLANDPNQIMWFYGFSEMGNVVMSSPVVGKVTSSSKRGEPYEVDPDSMGFAVKIAGETKWTNEVMGPDGMYGSSDPYVYWFTPEGQYFQWSGNYVISNAPVRTEKPIFNVRDIDYKELERGKAAEQALKAGKKVDNNFNVSE